MAWSYNGLWKLLIDNEMKKHGLRKKLKIGPATMAKMSKGEPVSMDVLEKLCREFDVDVSEIVRFVND